MGSWRFLAASAVVTALGGALLGCGGGGAGATTASPSCYPSCVATLLQECPLEGMCQGTVGATAAQVCYANGIKVRDELISGPETVTVTNASGQACYTVTQTLSSTGQTARVYTVTVNGQSVATLTDNQTTLNSATITCGNVPTVLPYPKPGADCQPKWWTDEQRCTSGTCSP